MSWRDREKYALLFLAVIVAAAYFLGFFTDDKSVDCPKRADARSVRFVDGDPGHCIYTLTDGHTVSVERP